MVIHSELPFQLDIDFHFIFYMIFLQITHSLFIDIQM